MYIGAIGGTLFVLIEYRFLLLYHPACVLTEKESDEAGIDCGGSCQKFARSKFLNRL